MTELIRASPNTVTASAAPVVVSNEDIEVAEPPFSQALEMVKTSEIRDGKTVCALFADVI